MKSKILIFIFAFSLTCGWGGENSMVFAKLQHNFGDIELDKSYSVEFSYTNKSQSPLVILSSEADCGCTEVKYSKKPLLSGKKELLKVIFNPTDKGAFYKKIVIKNSLNERVTLVIKGLVK